MSLTRSDGTQWLRLDRMPTLNEMMDAKSSIDFKSGRRGRHDKWSRMKTQIEERIGWACKFQGIQAVAAASFSFLWIEPDRRRDHDNVTAGKKVVLDALVRYQVLPNDTRRYVTGSSDRVYTSKRLRPGVIVAITACAPGPKQGKDETDGLLADLKGRNGGAIAAALLLKEKQEAAPGLQRVRAPARRHDPPQAP